MVTHAGALTAEEDIGKVVARAVNDPRTANKKLVIKVNTLTQSEIIATWERVHGKTAKRVTVSSQQIDEKLQGQSLLLLLDCATE